MKIQAGMKPKSTAARNYFHAAAQVLRWKGSELVSGNRGNAVADSLLLPAISPLPSPPVKPRTAWEGNRALGLQEAATLYEMAIGESPHEVVSAGRAVLIETGVVGCYADFPNGYVPILISRTPDGCVIFDTGQTAPKRGGEAGAVLRDGDTLYVKTDKGPEDLRRGIHTMVSALRRLHEGH